MGPKSSFVCATYGFSSVCGSYSILISSLFWPTKASTTGMNAGNQVTGALFNGLCSFGLLDFLILCFSEDLTLCLSVWLAFV